MSPAFTVPLDSSCRCRHSPLLPQLRGGLVFQLCPRPMPPARPEPGVWNKPVHEPAFDGGAPQSNRDDTQVQCCLMGQHVCARAGRLGFGPRLCRLLAVRPGGSAITSLRCTRLPCKAIDSQRVVARTRRIHARTPQALNKCSLGRIDQYGHTSI